MMDEISKQIIITLLCLPGVVILAYLVSWLWGKGFKKIATKTPTELDNYLIKGLKTPLFLFILVHGFYIIFQKLGQFEGIKDTQYLKYVLGFFYSANVVAIIHLLCEGIRAIADWYLAAVAMRTETPLDEEFVPLVNRLLRIVLFFIAATIILSHFNINIFAFVTTAGIASLAFAFAAQETLANMISGFSIMLDRPFRVGDRIELEGGDIGDVYEIGLRSTKILSFDNTLIILPNNKIARSRVINHSYPTLRFKIRLPVSVAYGSDMEKVKKVLLDIVHQHAKILDKPEPVVYFMEFADSSLNLLLICWIEDYKDKFILVDDLNMQIDRKFAEENIEIPFPQRDVHIISPPEEKGKKNPS